MNIKQAKEEIKHTVQAYLLKDGLSRYQIDTVRQRPVLLMGPPGIGKTAVMEQIAQELSIALVSYTMTHHTRQSAIGLPYIEECEYEKEKYSITRYTMSEIISSVYDKMKESGKKEGVLFLDEINCVSETLAPAMLQFLQGKTFGNQKLPEGWVIVAAGNPPEYNRSVREFDVVTLDRVREITVEADYRVFREYAMAQGIHGAVLSYLDIKKDAFYLMETEVDGLSYVTARGWEDLSDIMKAYETLGLPVTKEVVNGYLHHEKTAADFANYLELYRKYEQDYQIEKIWDGRFGEEHKKRLREASFDERLSVLTMLLSAMRSGFLRAYEEDRYVTLLYEDLLTFRDRLGMENVRGEAVLSMLVNRRMEELRKKKASVRLSKIEEGICQREIEKLREYQQYAKTGEGLDAETLFDEIKHEFSKEADRRESVYDLTGQHLDAVFAFLEEVFGDGEEMVIFVTELNVGKYSLYFLKERDCEAYFKYNRELMVHQKREQLLSEIQKEI